MIESFSAVRAMEEKADALRNIGSRLSAKLKPQKEEYESRAARLEQSAAVLRQLLTSRDT